MQLPLSERLERKRDALIMKRRQSKVLKLPSWWRTLAPTMPARFWCRVEMLRRDAGVQRSDVSAITYIVDKLRSTYHVRKH